VTTEGARQVSYAPLPATVTALLAESVSRYGDRDAVIDGERVWTYRELDRRVRWAARCLRDQGLGSGDRVALLLVNSGEFVVWFLATARIGAISTPLNTRLTASELAVLLGISRPRVLVFDAEWADKVAALSDGLFGRAVPAHAYEAWRGSEAGPEATVAADDALTILFTSGTTGSPKGAVLSHRNVLTSVESYRYIFRLGPEDRTLVTVPLFHVTGLVGQLLPVLRVGGAASLLRRFDERVFLERMRADRITMFFGVPTIFVRILGHPALRREELGAWRIAASGGAPLAVATVERLTEMLPGVALFNTYGMTEVSSPATILPPAYALPKNGSVGLPVPTATLRIVHPETGADVDPGQAGELLIAGPMVMQGYWDNPEATAHTVRGGYVHSGDIAKVDGDGFVYILDRIKDVINRGGEKIFGGEIEDVLYRHPDVLEASVVGVPDPVWGETVAAMVVPKPRHTIDADEVRRWVRQHLAAYKVPAAVMAVPELPRNANGKVDKRQVRLWLSR
jgi:long-chain acyl-CoA synthetase